ILFHCYSASLCRLPYSHCFLSLIFFFFNVIPTTEFYTLSLHDALPISVAADFCHRACRDQILVLGLLGARGADDVRGKPWRAGRSEEHTSELQSRGHLVCRLLLEKKKGAHFQL